MKQNIQQVFKYFLQIIKYILLIIVIFCLWSFLIVISIPIYEKWPETDTFQYTRITKYIIVWENTWLQLDITNNQTQQTNTIISKETNQNIFPADNTNTTFNFTNQKDRLSTGKSYFFIQFSNQTTIVLYPETSINFTKNINNITIQKQAWKLEYYLPKNNTNITIQSGTKINYNDFVWKDLLIWYDNDKDKYIIKQLWWNIMLNPQINKFRKTVLDILYKIRPNKYQNNQDNYKEFQKILKRKESQPTKYINNQKEIQNDIWNQIKRSFSQSQIAN